MMDGGCRASRVFGDTCKIIGRWSEFKFCSMSSVDVKSVGFCVVM